MFYCVLKLCVTVQGHPLCYRVLHHQLAAQVHARICSVYVLRCSLFIYSAMCVCFYSYLVSALVLLLVVSRLCLDYPLMFCFPL